MNETLKAITRLMEEGTPELKVAAAQVLGELKPQASAVVQALGKQLTYGDNVLNRYILQALSQIGSDEAVAILVSRLRDGGPTRDLVCHLLGQAGSKAVKPLTRAYDTEEGLQEQLLQILGQYHETEAIAVLRKALLSEEKSLSATAAAFLGKRLPELSEARRKSFRESLHKAVVKKTEDLPPASLAQALAVLRTLDGAASRPLLLKFAGPTHPASVRKAALSALKGVKLTPTQAGKLLAFIRESDLDNVVRPTIAALSDHCSWPPAAIKELRRLWSSRREEMKLFAIRALTETHTEEMAKLYLPHLTGPKPALANNPKALPVLLKAFTNERNAEKAAILSEPLAGLADHFSPSKLKSMCEKTARLLGQQDPLGQLYLDLLLGVDAEGAGRELADKAVRLRRARKLPEALTILMHLAKADCLDLEGRYQMALARLIMDHEEGRAGITQHTGDATMGYIAGLVRDGFPVLDRLKKESMLEPEDLLRVGRHFNESIGPERRFGTELLRHVAEKHGKVKAGEEARMMIRTAGL
jgi:HEAT repeat protein